ncbi:MAG: bifunctional tRNA (5-methylaminomethyl-2-thiouridine)(34)-methyltransferase MnmD/FAD-dependent 5-carboxymethylaminomethyl-2-thiouridine(34) oxidoreductase MnmC [Enterobacteriaceae bacterium]
MKSSFVTWCSLSFNEQGTPVSREFDDIYFSAQDGLAETQYVFLQGNRLSERFAQHDTACFVVAETGFGTGLNFLSLCQLFHQFRQQMPTARLQRLHVISCEKFPLTLGDLRRTHAHWPHLAPWSEQLYRQWPLPIAGCHRLLLEEENITLDLWLGDIQQNLNDMCHAVKGQVDAWFLDGFAPAKNPDMWRDELFSAMGQMSHPGTTLATFTSAGFVRRVLQAAGFTIHKRPGFAQKREMLTGEFAPEQTTAFGSLPYAHTPPQSREVAIIGGGAASAFLASALLDRADRVTLYCQDPGPAQGASCNLQGALYPLLNDDVLLSDFYARAFMFARHRYDQFVRQGVEYAHQWCGVAQLACDDDSQNRIAKIKQKPWPTALVYPADADAIEQSCGLPTACDGVIYPAGGWLSPAQLLSSLFTFLQSQGLRAHWNSDIVALFPEQEGWRLQLANGDSRFHHTVVLANGHQIGHFEQTARLPFAQLRGQVSHIPSGPQLQRLKQVLCYNGYLVPHSPVDGYLRIGASHNRQELHTHYSEREQQSNRQRLLDALPGQSWPLEVDISAGMARCGIRSTVRDHFPMVGTVPDHEAIAALDKTQRRNLVRGQNTSALPHLPHLYLLGGLGARGLCTAPLLAQLLADQIHGAPLPLDQQTLEALAPARFYWRKLRKEQEI